MKKYIQSIKDKGPEHVSKMSKIFAGLTTLAIVILWLVMSFVFRSNEPVQEEQEPANGPDVGAFLEQAEKSLTELGQQYQQGASNLKRSVGETEVELLEEGAEVTEN